MYYLFDEYPLAGVPPVIMCRSKMEVIESLLFYDWLVYVMTPTCMVLSREQFLS